MSNFNKFVIGFCLFLSSIVGVTIATMTDIKGYKYEDSIKYLVSKGVVNGYDDGTYRPDSAISRAELMKIILEGLDVDIGSGSNCFPDVKNQRYSQYICYGKDKGIAKGYSDGTFKPDQKVTIAEGLKITFLGFDMGISQGKGSDRYKPYLEFSHNNNIFSKYAVIPSKEMTRGQMAFLVHKLMLNKAGSLEFDNIRDVTSPGCGKSPPSTPPIESIVNGVVRHYITVVGDNYDPDKPIKLIFAFHGRTNSNTQVREYYDIEEESDGNAIIVYPSGLPEETSPRSRSNPGDKSSRLRDFALFDQILKEFNNNYCINQDEIFVVGHSLGAWFTNSLACARGDVIRGIGSVGGGTTINDCAGPVSAIIMHNPIDNLAPFKSGEIARDQLLKQNQCESVKKSVGPDGLQCVEYSCLDNATTIWCPYTNSVNYNGKFYPHMRPDSAGSYIYDFLDLQE